MKQNFFALDYLSVFLGLFLTLLLVHIGIIKQGSNIAIEIIAALIFMYMPLIMVDIFKNDQACNAFVDETKKAVKAAKQKYRRTFLPPFPRHLAERGAICRDLRTTARTARPTTGRGTGRQHGSSTSVRQAGGKSSSDGGDDGDGEPPQLPLLFPLLPLLFTYLTFALLVGCSPKTLRNKVSAGLFPKPIQTRFGPRFTQSHLALVLTPQTDQPPAKSIEKRKRGRPRIADYR